MKNNYEELKNRYLGKKVRVICEGKYHYCEGVVEEIKNNFFHDMVIMFNGAPKNFHANELLVLN